jgi:HK97 family phage major capsid protein
MTPEELKQSISKVLDDREKGLLTSDGFIKAIGDQLTKLLGDDYKDINKIKENLTTMQQEMKNIRLLHSGDQNTKQLSGLYDGVWKSVEMAKDFGLFVLASTFGSKKAAEKLSQKGYVLEKDMSASDNTTGGILVPTQIIDGLIMLVKQYGLIRRNALVMPMSSDSAAGMKLSSGLTVYCPGAGVLPDSSKPLFAPIGLQAKEWVTYVLIDNSLSEDAAIMIGDIVGELIAMAFAQKEDEVGLLGDGSSTYFNHVGIAGALAGLTGTPPGIIVGDVAGKTLWDSIDITHFEAAQAAVHEAADDNVNLKWYCSRAFYFKKMRHLALASGGSTAEEMLSNRVTKVKTFLGDQVEFSSVMPKTGAASQLACYYGNLRRGMILGDRRMQAISQSTQYKFAERQTTILGTERIAIGVYGQGTATEAGTITAIKTAA